MIDIENLTLKQLNEINKIFNSKNNKSKITDNLIGKKVIIRTYSAGVHFGVLDEVDGGSVRLKNCRRIWRWDVAFTLSEVSVKGIPKSSKLSCLINEIILNQVIEIIPCSNESIKSLEEIEDYRQ